MARVTYEQQLAELAKVLGGGRGRGRYAAPARTTATVARRTAWGVRYTARKSYARRRGLAPVYWAAVLWLAGFGMHQVPGGGRTAAGVVAVGTALLWWRGRRRKWTPGHWRPAGWQYHAAVYAAGAVWLVAAATRGAGAPMPGVLLVGALAAGIPWWWHHRIRPHDTPTVDERRALWAQHLAQTGDLVGSVLEDITEEKHGAWTAHVELPPASPATRSTVTAARARIAKVYRVPATSVVVEPTLEMLEHRARLMILRSNPLQKVLPFPGPQLDQATGELRIGLFPDGTPATWRIHIPGSGACHGLISGTTGSGKSGLVQNICAGVHLSDRHVLWLGDGQRGKSVPDWRYAAAVFADSLQAIRAMLVAAAGAMDGRGERMAREEWIDDKGRRRTGHDHFDPTPGVPELVVVVEEAPVVLADRECARIVKRIAQEGRKVGVCVIVVVQVPSMRELGGDGIELRSLVSGMNVACFRTTDAFSGRMAAGQKFPVDPQTIPQYWPDGSSAAGLGYLIDERHAGTTMRAYRVADPYDYAEQPAGARLDAATQADGDRAVAEWAAEHDQDTPPASPVTRPMPAAAASIPERLLAVLRAEDRELRTGVIAELSGVPLPNVSRDLRRLEERRLVERVGHGVWQLADDRELEDAIA